MAPHQSSLRAPLRLHGPARAVVLAAIALALAVVLALIWGSVAHPEGASIRLWDGPPIGGPAGVRRVTAWLLIAACSLVAVTGVVLLAMDFRAGRLGGGRPGRHVRQRPAGR